MILHLHLHFYMFGCWQSSGAKVAVCELPFDYKSSETKGGVGGT
jgi:hypothetical protein